MAGHSSGLNLYWDPLNGGPTTDAWIAQTMSRIGRVYRIILREEAEAKKNKRKRDQEDLEEERQKGDGKGDSKGGGKDSEVDIKGDSSKGGGKGVSKGGDSVVDYEELWELI